MSTYQHDCNSDFRNEGWTFNGTGVDACWKAWSVHGDDTKYCKNPGNKGRGCVRFPIDVDSSSIPDGAVITSITLFLRCSKTDSSDRTVTINLLCSDDTSRFTSRTIHPTTTITTIEVGTFTVDCLGNPWTKDRLNRLMCQVFSYCGIADKIRCHEFYVVVNYRVRPTVSIQLPTGTVTSPSPTVSWTYAQTDGDPQKKADYKIFTAIQQESFSFNPDTSPAVFTGHITGDTTSFTLPTSLTPDTYYIYARVTSSFGARSVWSERSFTVTGSSPGVPGGQFGGIGVGGGGGFVSVIADPVTSNSYLTLRDGSNLLSVQQSDFETTTDGLGYVTTNCTVVQDTSAWFNIGGGSMKLTASSAATMSVVSSFTEIAQSTPVTARAQFKSAVTSRSVSVGILFFDSMFNALGGTITGSGTDVTTTWTDVSCTGTAPVNASYAQVQLTVTSPANAEVHNVDAVGLMYGTNSVWSNGGHASRNLLSSAASNAEDTITTEPWAATNSATTYTRVASAGTGADGNKRFKMTYVGISPTVSFVATGTAFTDTSTGTGYTLNKPAGIADGDLLVAYVASNTGGAAIPPTGWLVQDTVTSAASDNSLTIMTHDGLAADPATWTGNTTSTKTRCRAVVVAYRGAANSLTQFLASGVATTANGSPNPTTATVNNTDANAWRLSAFADNDDVTGGTSTANIVPPAVGGITFVSAASEWTDTTSGGTFTINKPASVVTGDLMIASVAGAFTGSTVSTPTGWTKIDTQTGAAGPHTQVVFIRTVVGGDPSSWSGTITGGTIQKTKVVQCVAYRNADTAANQFIAQAGTVKNTSSSTLTTPSVANTNSSSWRICIFSADGGSSSSFSGEDTSERCDDSVQSSWSGTYATTNAISDSNGVVSTGTYSKTATLSHSFYAGAAWMGFIKALPSGPTPGANETERQDATAGASNPWMTLAVYDSGGVAATGTQSVTQTFSGSSPISSCQWVGILAPLAKTISGEASSTLVSYVDISSVNQDVIDRAGGMMTVTASFLGSTNGTPYLTLYSYVGNELISTQLGQGTSFNTSTWTKSAVTFPIPDGTTRVKLGVAGEDRLVNDIVYFDRVSVAFGSDTVYRSGTGRTTHPVFDIPIIEFNEDRGSGYGDWSVLPGSSAALLKYDQLTGLTTFVDQTIVPLSSRKYRAKTVSYGLAGDKFVSNYGAESDEVTLQANEWWLKDLSDSESSMKLKVKADPLSVSTDNTSAVFQPLGADRAVVLTEGYKSDTIDIVVIVDRLEYAQLRELLNSGRTLYLQSNLDNAWWVRPVGNLAAETQLTSQRSTNPLRFVKVVFTEVAPEL